MSKEPARSAPLTSRDHSESEATASHPELEKVRRKLGLPVEPDRWFEPTCFTTILEKHAPHLLFDENILRKIDPAMVEQDPEPS